MTTNYTNWRYEFYHNAKKEGFKYCVIEYIQMFSEKQSSWHKLKNKKELWELPFILEWVEKNNHNNLKKWEFRESDYLKSIEQDLVFYNQNGESYLIAYVMDLKKFKANRQTTYETSDEVDEVRRILDDRYMEYWKSKLISLFPSMSTCQAGDSFDLKNTSAEEVTVYRLNEVDFVDGDKYKVIHDHEKKTITIKDKNDK